MKAGSNNKTGDTGVKAGSNNKTGDTGVKAGSNNKTDDTGVKAGSNNKTDDIGVEAGGIAQGGAVGADAEDGNSTKADNDKENPADDKKENADDKKEKAEDKKEDADDKKEDADDKKDPEDVNKQSSEEYSKRGLEAHNMFRKIHDAPDMKINKKMSEEAEKYAKKLADSEKFEHSKDSKDGENLAMKCSSQEDDTMLAEEATKNWYEMFLFFPHR